MNDSLPDFLANAIALEHEAAERYLELADMMEAHRNDAVSALFRDMVHYSRLHHDSIVERARGAALPPLRPGPYRWRHPPEAGDEQAFDPMLDAHDALRYARENELRAMDYYTQVGLHAPEAAVRRLAAESAGEEAEHVDALDDWLARTPRHGSPRGGSPASR